MATYTKETALYDTGKIGDEFYAIGQEQTAQAASISMKIDKPNGVEGNDLVSSIQAIADFITLSASRINFTSTSSVADELATLTNAVVIDTDPSHPSITIGDTENFHVVISNTRMSFKQASQEVAYVSNNQLYISKSVVLMQMDLGIRVDDTLYPDESKRLGQWSWKVHANGDNPRRNNLNLKWIG